MRLKNRAGVAIGLWIWLCVQAQASLVGFNDDFAPSSWSMQPELGSIYFTDLNTRLHVDGPTGLAFPNTSSADLVSYIGPAGTGLPTAGTLSFTWSFNSGDALSAGAGFSYRVPQHIATTRTLAQGGPGTIATGTITLFLEQGSTLSFLLTTLNPDGKKSPAQLIVSDFSFDAVVPEPSTWLAGLPCGAFMIFNMFRRVRRTQA